MYRILFVDDEKDIVEVSLKRLIKSGYEVYTATNGKDALDLTIKHVPDLIISDVIMPGMNGFEFCKAVKNNAKTKDIPIIVITANRSGLEDSFMFLGINDFLLKPFDLDQLDLTIKNRLTLARQMHTQKTKIIFHCTKESILSSARMLIESVPQWMSKFTDSGRELIARAKEMIPDIIILDLFMNDMSAEDAVMELRSVPELAHTEILTYYSPLSEGDDKYIIQARMIEVQYLKTVTAAAGVKEYLGPLNDPKHFIGMFKEYCKDF